MLETAAGVPETGAGVELWWQSQTVVVKVVFWYMGAMTAGTLLIVVVATLEVLEGGVIIAMVVGDEVVGGIDCGWTETGAEVEVVIGAETEAAVVATARLKGGQKL